MSKPSLKTYKYGSSGIMFDADPTVMRSAVPANTWHQTNVVWMLVHRLRRWPNIQTTCGQCVMLAGSDPRWFSESSSDPCKESHLFSVVSHVRQLIIRIQNPSITGWLQVMYAHPVFRGLENTEKKRKLINCCTKTRSLSSNNYTL